MALRVAFIGAGAVNFGGGDPGSCWDHATRLEVLAREKLSLKVVGISDPNSAQMEKVLSERKANNAGDLWTDVKTFTNVEEMLDETKPEAVFIGVPPFAHGKIEEACARRGVHMFIEKPISCEPPVFVEQLNKMLDKNPELIVSVGYMLRYHKATQFIKNYLSERNLRPLNICARYNCAYVSIAKPMWWNKKLSGGPVLEQGTHFCDLLRYFGGEIDLHTVSAVGVSASSPIGQLSEIPPGVEDGLPIDQRINRAVSANFKFASGAIGSLQHGLLMKGDKYFTEFEIWADGVLIKLIDPYSPNCRVKIFDSVQPVQIFRFKDDPYLEEDEIFLQAVKTSDNSKILSSYADAVETHKLAYKIQNGSGQESLKLSSAQ
jgi:predicted dehydrogenase